MRKKFTLLELTVVMLIVGVILSLSLVGLDKLVTAESLNTAAGKLDSAVLLSRSLATNTIKPDSSGEPLYVALLLPDTDKFREKGGEPCRSYRICYVDKDYKFNSWINGQEWTTFAPGVVIAGALKNGTADQRKNPMGNGSDDDINYKLKNDNKNIDVLERVSDTKFNAYKTSKGYDPNELTNKGLISDVPGNKDNNYDCPGIVFNRYGNVINAADLCLLLTEGYVLQADNKEVTFRFKNIFQIGKNNYLSNWVEVPLNIFSGKTQLRFQGADK